jgi:hypothetical protein
MRVRKKTVIAGIGVTVVAVLGGGAAVALAGLDFGVLRDRTMNAAALPLFGVNRGLDASSTTSANPADASADATKLVTVAPGLKAKVVTQGKAAPNLDQLALWPNDKAPTHVIACNEQGSAQIGLQAIKISDGSVQTIVKSGLTSCDPTRLTPWGTVIFGEENGANGRMFEMVDPLGTADVVVNPDGSTTGGTHPENIVNLRSLGKLSYESLALYSTGLLYYGDEQRPSRGNPGGAYFKFVPSVPWNGAPITAAAGLVSSPLASGTIFGFRAGKNAPDGPNPGGTDYGQGTQTGLGTWIQICTGVGCSNIDLRAATPTNKLTGYYRPEDSDVDEVAAAQGLVRWCANNTGNEFIDHNWGETICFTDGTIADAMANTATPEAQYLVVGNPEYAMPDNIDLQPGTGNALIQEDGSIADTHKNNDLWDCLPDGNDVDQQSDGCLRVATINDLIGSTDEPGGAEWTGGVFDASGRHFFVSVQHNMTNSGVILDITGWKVPFGLPGLP